MTSAILAAAPALVAAPALAAASGPSEWELDAAHTTVQFAVRHMMITTVRGQLEKVSGTVSLDDSDLTKSRVEVTIDAASINTRTAARDEHLRSADFFDVAKTPTITFRSTKIERAGKGRYKVTGDLTMRGVTKPVVLAAIGPSAAQKDPWGRSVRAVSATGKINRKEWGLTWNKGLEMGGVLVGDEVTLQIDAELVPKAKGTAANQ